MSFADLVSLVYRAMLPEFTVFGVTLNLWSCFCWSIAMSVIALIIRLIMRW